MPYSIVVILTFLLAACQPQHEVGAAAGDGSEFEKIAANQSSIQKNFINRQCLSCHDQALSSNRYVDLRDLTWIIEGAGVGNNLSIRKNLIKAGCPKESFLLSVIKSGEMPPAPERRVDQQTIQILNDWILSLWPNRNDCGDEPPD